jgi:trehalose 6-phosphate synthase
MDAEEGAKRMRAMRRHLAKNDLDHWASSFFDALRGQAAGQPTGREAGRTSAPLSQGRGGAQG